MPDVHKTPPPAPEVPSSAAPADGVHPGYPGPSAEDVLGCRVEPADCPYDPRQGPLAGQGMHHCPECGEMVLGGFAHPGKLVEVSQAPTPPPLPAAAPDLPTVELPPGLVNARGEIGLVDLVSASGLVRKPVRAAARRVIAQGGVAVGYGDEPLMLLTDPTITLGFRSGIRLKIGRHEVRFRLSGPPEPELSVTLEQILSWSPCRPYTRVRLVELFAGRERITVQEILDLPIPAQDRLWAALREELVPDAILHEFACRCAETALVRERDRGCEPDPRSWRAVAVKRVWLRGLVSEVELAEAAESAWSSAVASWSSVASAAESARSVAWSAAAASAAASAVESSWSSLWWSSSWSASWSASSWSAVAAAAAAAGKAVGAATAGSAGSAWPAEVLAAWSAEASAQVDILRSLLTPAPEPSARVAPHSGELGAPVLAARHTLRVRNLDPAPAPVEEVLCVPRFAFDEAGAFEGFRTGSARWLTPLLREATFRHRTRGSGGLEEDPTWKQLVAYTVLRHEGTVAVFRRASGSGEGRLLGRLTVGVGGHVGRRDVTDPGGEHAALTRAALRELAEEVVFPAPAVEFRRVGLVNDDRDPVGRVHLGVVYVLDLAEPEVRAPGEDMEFVAWHGPEELKRGRDEFESWSRILIDELLAREAGRI